MSDRLKFGYFTLSDNSVGYGERRRDPGELIKDVVNEAIAAEGLGYNSAWLPEHHFGFFGVLPPITEPNTVVPNPIQQPHPPIYVACFSEPTMRMAAEHGFHIIFAPFAASMLFGSLANAVARFKELSSAGGYPDSRAMCSYFTCIADTPEDKRKAQERLLYYLTNFIPAVPQDPEKTPPHIRYFIDIADRVKRMKPPDLGERSIVTGTADEVIHQFEQVEAAGIEEVICYFNFGLLPHAETLHQMRRVSREVMPHFARGERVEAALTAASRA